MCSSDLEQPALNRLFVLFAAIMSIGLFCVFLKIGRQLRFWRALRKFDTSWMSRELYVVMVFFATQPGEVAFDNADGNGSVFTS